MLIHNDNDKKSFFVEFYLCIESFQKDQSIVDTSFLRQAQAPYKTLISTYTPPNLDVHNQNKENQIHLPIVLINVPVKNDYFTSATVSLQIASSSFVGITATLTLESAVEITISSPRFPLASSSIAIPRYPR